MVKEEGGSSLQTSCSNCKCFILLLCICVYYSNYTNGPVKAVNYFPKSYSKTMTILVGNQPDEVTWK